MSTDTTAALRDFAVIVDARDNVAVAKTEIPPDLVVAHDGAPIRVTGTVTPGNRFALRAIPKDDFVRQYGQPIGTSRGIRAGPTDQPDLVESRPASHVNGKTIVILRDDQDQSRSVRYTIRFVAVP